MLNQIQMSLRTSWLRAVRSPEQEQLYNTRAMLCSAVMLLHAATSNPGKLRDFGYAVEFQRDDFSIQPLPGLAGIVAPPEDEPTFEANARVKAAYYSRHAPGRLVLADDSGLEVAALGGAPGVRSARYADDQQQAQRRPLDPALTLDERNNAALLASLAGIPEDGRRASYRCVLALARDGEVLQSAEGCLHGVILTAPRGSSGFGYDPIFYLPECGFTMAEIDPVMRMKLSHRGRALRNLLPLITGE